MKLIDSSGAVMHLCNLGVKVEQNSSTALTAANHTNAANAVARCQVDSLTTGAVLFSAQSNYTGVSEFAGKSGLYTTGQGASLANLVLAARSPDAGIDLYTGGAASGNKRWMFNSTGHFMPGTSSSFDIGSSSFRARDYWGVGADFSGHVKLGANGTSLRFQDRCVEKEFAPTFPNGIPNQKLDLYFTGQVWGLLEVIVFSDYTNQNAAGAIVKQFQIGLFDDGSTRNIYHQSTRHTAVSTLTAQNFAISDVTFDSTNQRWRIQIVHRTSTSNGAMLRIRAFLANQGGAANIAAAGISSVYTTDSTVFAAPVVSFDTDVVFNGNTQTKGIAFAVGAKTANYTATINDYLITCNTTSTGFTITLPALSSVPSGFVLNIKKISNDSNTLTIDGNGSETIDGQLTQSTTTRYKNFQLIAGTSEWHILSTYL